MPANVPPLDPSELSVMPLSLCSAFAQTSEYACLLGEYVDGSSQRRLQISNGGDRVNTLPRMHWKFTKRLTPDKMVELRNFYDSVSGPATPFVFYDPQESVFPFNYDSAGFDPDGRFIVRFVGQWSQSQPLGRGTVSLELVELAQAVGSGQLDFTRTDSAQLIGAL